MDEDGAARFFADRGISTIAIIQFGLSLGDTAHATDTPAGLAALFMQGVQVGILLSEQAGDAEDRQMTSSWEQPSDQSVHDSTFEDLPEFEYEGFFTHWICSGCGHNDYDEGDTRGDELTCPSCGLRGRIPS